MESKLVKDLSVGDRVMLREPDGVARITKKERNYLFEAAGKCWALDLKIESGPNKGQTLKDQVHAGLTRIEVPEAAH